ncbi:MAG TPA: hypothetical protein VL972_07125 [Solirubrobacteraceae bacterium]|nr:hypothetical protein [Solirubrobacteraceae bacterium]
MLVIDTGRAEASTFVRTPGEAAPTDAQERQRRRRARTARKTHTSTSELATAVATSVAAVVAILALLGAGVTIRDNRRAGRQRATFESVARLEDPHLLECKSVTSAFLRCGLRPPSIAEAAWREMNDDARRAATATLWEELKGSPWLADRELVQRIQAFPNLLEGVAGMYNDDLLDTEIVEAQVSWIAWNFWQEGEWWIAKVKSEDGNAFAEIETMVGRLRARSGSSE